MNIRTKGIPVFPIVFLMADPARALDADLNGRRIGLQYGAPTFEQAGDTFMAVGWAPMRGTVL